MGPKITVDSATMMNKGLEIIEAHFLFGFDYDHIDVIVHPQSVVHGMAELVDGGVILHAAPADMRIPIQAALTAPDHVAYPGAGIDLASVGELTFEPVDHDRFPAIRLAYEVGRRGRTYPAAMNAANEVAVAAFLDGRIAFTDIVGIVADVVIQHEPLEADDLGNVLAADGAARSDATRIVEQLARVVAGS
jgi:1-deoxy-D-xylulose-5-phosphate reductoisomerase